MAKRKRKLKDKDLAPFYICSNQLHRLNQNIEALAGTMVTIGLTHNRLVERIEQLDHNVYRVGRDVCSVVNCVSREMALARMRRPRLWDRLLLWWQNRQWRRMAKQTDAEQKKRMEELTGADAPSCGRWK